MAPSQTDTEQPAQTRTPTRGAESANSAPRTSAATAAKTTSSVSQAASAATAGVPRSIQRAPESAPRTAVVGAGVVGLLTAWQLRLAGHAVTILDPAPGSEASHAAAGMLAPIGEVQYGQQQLWDLMTAARAEYPPLFQTLAAATAEPTGYRDTPSYLVAADPGDKDAVADLVSVQQAQGMTVEPLTGSRLRRAEPALAPGLAKAWEVPSDHQVNPRQLIRCVNAALTAELDPSSFATPGPRASWLHSAVTAIETTDDDAGSPQVTITTGEGPHTFDSVVISPGLGYTEIRGIPQEHPVPLRPVHGDVIRLRVREEQLAPGEGHLISATIRARVAGRPVYLVPRAPEDPLEPRGLVIGASSREDGLAGTHTGSVQELLEDAAAVLPAVRESELVEITTRARPGTPDDRPYLGEVSPGVVVSTGYHRHGILLAPLAARLAAALVTGTQLSQNDTEYLEAMRLGR
ncbi:glycine oxidase ThiO [Nesterenkonia sedimenti]|uniref:glycine oxidase ThiO n=1 Tax=Nesterenkonia sedimenti TaxID=1463632 RepID=UPI002D21910D|nr:glycine oxidase ThiO [Nesterenkonia sedimenti]